MENEITSGLGIPENYFSSLKEDIFREIEISEAEEFITKTCGAKHGLTVPDSYFSKLATDISEKTRQKKATKTFTLRRSLLLAGSIAACLTVFFFLEDEPKNAQVTFDQLLAEATINDDYLEYLDLESIELISEASLSEESIENSDLDFLLDDDEMLEELIEL